MKAKSQTLSSLSSFTFPEPLQIDAEATLAVYEALRPVLPQPDMPEPRKTDRLTDILDQFDALILDGFGVINVGPDKIDGIEALLQGAQERGIIIIILTNAASHPSSLTAQKYANWHLPIEPHHVVSSRDVIKLLLKQKPPPQPVMTLGHNVTPLGYKGELTAADDFNAAESFIMLGTASWDTADQSRLETALQKRLRPFYVANPDVSAPQIDSFSPEAGYFAARAMQSSGVIPVWGGKPHYAAFNLALAAVDNCAGHFVNRDRIAMVGDSPHTDILGGISAGLTSVLLTSYGLLRDRDVEDDCQRFGIFPHWIARNL